MGVTPAIEVVLEPGVMTGTQEGPGGPRNLFLPLELGHELQHYKILQKI